MATIGLDKLFYSKITEDEDGNETYATPASLCESHDRRAFRGLRRRRCMRTMALRRW